MGLYINNYVFDPDVAYNFFIGHKLSVHKQQQTTTAHLITYLEIIQSINKMILLSLRVAKLSHTHIDSRIW